MKYDDLDQFHGNIMKYENGKFVIHKENVILVYDAQLKCFIWEDNDYIDVFSDLVTGYIKNNEELEKRLDAISDHFLPYIPKQEEGYLFVDESSLEIFIKFKKSRKK